MPYSTYIRGVRQGHATTTLQPIIKRLAKLASAPLADANEINGAEVRVTDSQGVESCTRFSPRTRARASST